MSAKKNRVAQEGDSAMPVTPVNIDKIPWWVRDIAEPSPRINVFTQPRDEPGLTPGVSARAANLEESMEPSTSTSTKTSRRSGGLTASSKRRWRTPRDGKELAAQITVVATMVLNDDPVMPIEKARVYGGLVRADVQAMSVEVSRARFARTIPDLTFDLTVFDEEDDQ